MKLSRKRNAHIITVTLMSAEDHPVKTANKKAVQHELCKDSLHICNCDSILITFYYLTFIN